jgi:hypothetical protein
MKNLHATQKKMKVKEVKTPNIQVPIETLTDRIPKKKNLE